MVCSACGYENQAGMRFCGMCGMPLPHRPLTTPGAQSTLNYTRVPLETSSTEHETNTGAVSATQSGVQHITPGNGSGPTASSSTRWRICRRSILPHLVDEPPAKELVPDVSLDEYVQHFRYQPPTDPSEVTMRGDAAPTVAMEQPAITASGSEPTAEGVTPGSEPASESVDPDEIAFRAKVEAALHSRPSTTPIESKPEERIVPTAPPADSVASRLGLEPETASRRANPAASLSRHQRAGERKQTGSKLRPRQHCRSFISRTERRTTDRCRGGFSRDDGRGRRASPRQLARLGCGRDYLAIRCARYCAMAGSGDAVRHWAVADHQGEAR